MSNNCCESCCSSAEDTETFTQNCNKDERQTITQQPKPQKYTNGTNEPREQEMRDLRRGENGILTPQQLQDLRSRLNQQEERYKKDIDRRDSEINELKKEIDSLKNKNNELLTRLSATASAKLTDDNPNIADLSDINRPTKLSEQFSELYDNEWTDAFEALTNTKKGNKPEEEACKLLLGVMTTIYSKCYEKSKDGLHELTKALSSFNGMEVPSKVVLKAVKDDRKKNYSYTITKLREEVKPSLQSIITENDTCFIENYIDKCITLCWLMAIQDPPVYIDVETQRHDAKLDTERYKHYTQSGTAVDYIVWPVLYLHEGGHILCKGIAQGKKSEPDFDANPGLGTNTIIIHF
ncbi:uncharacterized protein LOC128554801 [Mercenaria mercenaria]|uniref:uncharacterized protein LOC128554801 n=1 Tax=Mercenaria mercenaria TaxID=6596 RepID=UPI00234F181A|nr:uncharacterized protein LOC128554801 [Mercenaria mercenaria]XP_053392089.1 uncharacterized protein LOC128554801 [Mercenaria mercenaria]